MFLSLRSHSVLTFETRAGGVGFRARKNDACSEVSVVVSLLDLPLI